jgi:hypothetical protein
MVNHFFPDLQGTVHKARNYIRGRIHGEDSQDPLKRHLPLNIEDPHRLTLRLASRRRLSICGYR